MAARGPDYFDVGLASQRFDGVAELLAGLLDVLAQLIGVLGGLVFNWGSTGGSGGGWLVGDTQFGRLLMLCVHGWLLLVLISCTSSWTLAIASLGAGGVACSTCFLGSTAASVG